MKRVLAGAAVVVAAMATAPAAHAAVVRAVDNDWISSLEYEAGPAEANRVDVTYALDAGGDYVVTIEDRGAVIATTTPIGVSGGTGCTTVGLHRAVCHYLRNSVHWATFTLGGGNNTFAVQGVAEDISILSGAGQDRLAGGVGSNYYQPGAGTDRVIGSDTGFDRVSYVDHTTPVTITVDGQANDGSAGENDVLLGIEDYEGGSGDNTLVGSEAADRLSGGPGTDTITGGGGDDVLGSGPTGPDHIVGGAGRDIIMPGLNGLVEAIDGEVDEIHCFGRANELRIDSQDTVDDCPN